MLIGNSKQTAPSKFPSIVPGQIRDKDDSYMDNNGNSPYQQMQMSKLRSFSKKESVDYVPSQPYISKNISSIPPLKQMP